MNTLSPRAKSINLNLVVLLTCKRIYQSIYKMTPHQLPTLEMLIRSINYERKYTNHSDVHPRRSRIYEKAMDGLEDRAWKERTEKKIKSE